MAKKKETKKKETKKKDTRNELGYSFDILGDDQDDLVWNAQEALDTIFNSRKNRVTGFAPMSTVQQNMIPYREFMFQVLCGSKGLPAGTIMEIIGAPGLGKTSLTTWLMGGAMLCGIPCAYMETEGKQMNKDHMLRMLHPDRKLAEKMQQRIGLFPQVRTLLQMEEFAEEWVRTMRGLNTRGKLREPVPMDTPIMLVVDSISKLLPKGEAAGYVDYGDLGDRSKRKAVGESSNLEYSKWMAGWTRRSAALFHDNNASIVLVSHQTEKVDMSGGKGGSSFMSAEAKALYNKSKIGGKAINQSASLQIILAYKGLAKDSAGNKIGKVVKARIEKNSYGPENGLAEWNLINSGFKDTTTEIEQAIRFEEGFANFMADKGYFGTKVLRKRYTCERIGAVNATASEFKALFDADSSAAQELGALLSIHGYDPIVDEILEEEEDDNV